MYTRKITQRGDEQVFELHPSELARLTRQTASKQLAGTLAEAEALVQIDEARAEEQDTLSGRSRRRSTRARMKHWSDKGAQLDGI
jgi:hypothetical protein